MSQTDDNSYLVTDAPTIKHLRPPTAIQEKFSSYADYNQCLTISKTAELLDSHPATIRRMLKSGKLEGIKNGRLVRVFQWSLDNYLVANRIISKNQDHISESNKPKRKITSTNHRVAMKELERLGI